MHAKDMMELTKKRHAERQAEKLANYGPAREEAIRKHPETLRRCLKEIKAAATESGVSSMRFSTPGIGHPELIAALQALGYAVSPSIYGEIEISWRHYNDDPLFIY